MPNHVVATPLPDVLVAKRCAAFPIEFVVRGFITGSTDTSMWTHYKNGCRACRRGEPARRARRGSDRGAAPARAEEVALPRRAPRKADVCVDAREEDAAGNYCGIDLPEGLVKNQRLATPLCTPTTKDSTHDVPIAPADIVASGRMTQEQWEACSKAALAIFARGQAVALSRGLVLVDTKYEFGLGSCPCGLPRRASRLNVERGLPSSARAEGSIARESLPSPTRTLPGDDGEILLIDEVHTPDSSRYWLASSYEARFAAGQEPENIDKEFLRLWYRERCDPYKDEVIPKAPDELVCELARRYVLLYELITGSEFDFAAASADVDRSAAVAAAL